MAEWPVPQPAPGKQRPGQSTAHSRAPDCCTNKEAKGLSWIRAGLVYQCEPHFSSETALSQREIQWHPSTCQSRGITFCTTMSPFFLMEESCEVEQLTHVCWQRLWQDQHPQKMHSVTQCRGRTSLQQAGELGHSTVQVEPLQPKHRPGQADRTGFLVKR